LCEPSNAPASAACAGCASAGAPREVYLTSPEDTPDPADYLTEIQFPIIVPG